MNLKDFTYHLPEEKIAKYPLNDRSSSKLLFYRQGKTEHHTFSHISSILPENSLLIFNDTRVIPARLFFSKSTGAVIEIFLLEPQEPFNERERAMEAESPVVWKCMIRNLKKWKENELSLKLHNDEVITARLISREDQLVELSWNSGKSFAEIIEEAGKIPLPPYMNREATEEDEVTYQTVYARQKGAVAAPTAGLHFTPEVLDNLKKSGIKTDYLTLHVSAGTFQPIKSENVKEHAMHEEEVILKRENLQHVIDQEKLIIPVGTTSMRTLESTYWFGVQLLKKEGTEFNIAKLYPYEHNQQTLPSRKEAYEAVLDHLEENQMQNIIGKTSIFIFPEYKFRVCDGLITNFHLPASTLILLVAALVGEDWRKIYEEALSNDYRFLSYGDSSLLLP